METVRAKGIRPRFLMYLPNSRLSAFHNRSPWIMLPRSFHALGYESTLVCAELVTDPPGGVHVVQTGLAVRTQGSLLKRGLLRSLIEPLLTFREIVNRKPDVVIVAPLRSSFFTFALLLVFYRAVFTSSACFIMKADTSLDDSTSSPLIILLSHGLLAISSRLLDLISLETSCAVKRAQEIPGVSRYKVVRVPIGFPQGHINLRTYEEVPREPVILCVARIARMKGQDVLLGAFVKIAGKYPRWSVRLVGPEEDLVFKRELVEYVASHGLQGRVSFVGPVEERVIDEEYARAAIFCLPSVHSESAGQVKYEATASGLPVVTTDVPCGQDDTDNGWMVARAGNAAHLAGLLEQLMRDEGARRSMVAQAQSRLISYKGVASLYLSELDRLESGLRRDRRFGRRGQYSVER